MLLRMVCMFSILMQAALITKGDIITIQTKQGKIKGTLLTSDNGQKFAAFRGIRYAEAPTGVFRFRPSNTFDENWVTPYDATKDGPICFQLDEKPDAKKTSPFKGSEDCLFINVYRPQKNNFEKFPVMIFIHGGGYMSGSGSSSLYGAERFMDKDIVLVTFNYRLGPFGFLSTADEVAPGNYGFLDQTLALKWVRHHISDFGGDPHQVTIFGESAGAVSVALHLLSPLSAGLFQAAIIQSGNPLADYGLVYQSPIHTAHRLADALHCPTTTTRMAIDCIKAKTATEILQAAYPLPTSLNNTERLFTFRPVVDDAAHWPSFLPDHPRQLLQNGLISKVPVISGITKDEGIMFYLLPLIASKDIQNGDSSNLPKLLSIIYPSLSSDPQRAKRAAKHIKAIYFNSVDETDLKKRFSVMNKIFGGDTDTSTDNFNEILASHGRTVYSYKFTHLGHESWLKVFLESSYKDIISELKMVAHGDELQYFFHCDYFANQTLIGDDKKVANELITLWTNFATTLNPQIGPNDVDEQQFKYRWNAYDTRNPQYLDINLKPKLVNGYLSEDRAFWNSIYQYDYWHGRSRRHESHHRHHHKESHHHH